MDSPSYLSHLLLPETLAQLGLFAVGVWGIIVAVSSLKTIKEQTRATAASAKAAEDDIALQKVGMEQWIDTDDWTSGAVELLPGATEALLPIKFSIVNNTHFKLVLNSVDIWIDREHASTVYFRKQLLTPDGDFTTVDIHRKLSGVRLQAFLTGVYRFEIGGEVSYIDAFKQEQKQRFGFHGACSFTQREFKPIAFDPPDAEEIEQQKLRRVRQQQKEAN